MQIYSILASNLASKMAPNWLRWLLWRCIFATLLPRGATKHPRCLPDLQKCLQDGPETPKKPFQNMNFGSQMYQTMFQFLFTLSLFLAAFVKHALSENRYFYVWSVFWQFFYKCLLRENYRRTNDPNDKFDQNINNLRNHSTISQLAKLGGPAVNRACAFSIYIYIYIYMYIYIYLRVCVYNARRRYISLECIC